MRSGVLGPNPKNAIAVLENDIRARSRLRLDSHVLIDFLASLEGFF